MAQRKTSLPGSEVTKLNASSNALTLNRLGIVNGLRQRVVKVLVLPPKGWLPRNVHANGERNRRKLPDQ